MRKFAEDLPRLPQDHSVFVFAVAEVFGEPGEKREERGGMEGGKEGEGRRGMEEGEGRGGEGAEGGREGEWEKGREGWRRKVRKGGSHFVVVFNTGNLQLDKETNIRESTPRVYGDSSCRSGARACRPTYAYTENAYGKQPHLQSRPIHWFNGGSETITVNHKTQGGG